MLVPCTLVPCTLVPCPSIPCKYSCYLFKEVEKNLVRLMSIEQPKLENRQTCTFRYVPATLFKQGIVFMIQTEDLKQKRTILFLPVKVGVEGRERGSSALQAQGEEGRSSPAMKRIIHLLFAVGTATKRSITQRLCHLT
jgi:hypothetical protein